MMSKIVFIVLLVGIASAQAITRYNYKDDSAARMSQLSHAIHSLDLSASVPQSCPQCYPSFQVQKLLSGTQERALVGWDSNINSVVVVLQSNDLQTWLDATTFELVPFGDSSVCSGCNVAKRLKDAYNRLASKGLIEEIQAVVSGHGYCGVTFTGHGVGGALASYAALVFGRVNDEQDHPLLLFTFGQPRYGDQAFTAAHDVEVENDFRVVHGKDIAPHIPEDSRFVHGGREIWYSQGMTTILGKCSGDSGSCSNSQSGFTSNDGGSATYAALYQVHKEDL